MNAIENVIWQENRRKRREEKERKESDHNIVRAKNTKPTPKRQKL
jgi:hypothetical protein